MVHPVYEAVDARIIRGSALPWGEATHDENNTIEKTIAFLFFKIYTTLFYTFSSPGSSISVERSLAGKI